MKVLFVCLGNICRSPSAEGVFSALMPDVVTDSAGTTHWHVGEAPYGPMQDAARARGVDLSHLRARQFQAVDFETFDLLIGMDVDNITAMEALRPQGNTTVLRLLTDYAPQLGVHAVPDPYYTRDFDGVLDLIDVCAHGLATDILGGT